MRLDLLLVRLRFAKSRSAAQRWIAEGHIRCNRARMVESSSMIAPGDVLTLPIGRTVKLIAVERLPGRRGPATEAQTCYRDLTLTKSLP